MLLALPLLIDSCKKEDNNYRLDGRITFAEDGQPLSGTFVKINKQILQNGIFSGTYTTAVSGTTDGSGLYSLTWPRENFASLQLTLEKPQYISRSIDLDVSSFTPGGIVTKNYSMYAESFVSVLIQNNGATAPTDQFSFTFTNAEFDCVCCSNGWKYFNGADIDTTFNCRVYGNSWLKYQTLINTSETDTTLVDSIWCPSFQTAQIQITY